MLRATSIVRKPAVKADRIADTVILDHEDRQRRRISLTARGGLAFLLDLDKPAVLNDGDALKLEDGRLVAVEPAPEKLLEIRAENPLRLMRVAWHIGNRHAPAEITAEAIYIGEDHVLAEMVRGQGCSVTPVTRAFRPERGAYDHGHAHHAHAHGHDHHAHDHAHDLAHHDHVHGADCGCGHDHQASHSHDVLDLTSGHNPGHGHKHGHDHDRHDHHHGEPAAHHHHHGHHAHHHPHGKGEAS